MRILLVEDDTEQLEPLHTALTEAGHIVDGVEDGELHNGYYPKKTMTC